ncbi:dual specificity calcium/calmodulin-dependent 3',5'-cyclic nucleotide phosphodiesterase 1 isoform X2 [Helicoverpa armigera]|uniref:dual specificity calcium/calmodulin-dependent 3',5'-cyclic nucleotide phosphodiesterase 1 isoform X2 n=1 Tax=Helicoverpa armigera TaxID=29058 RepID=UPI0030836399
MQRCGFCSMLSGLLRRAMCVGSRRGSSESYYRELGDQDTLKIEDKSSDLSDDAEEETSLCHGSRGTPRVSPRSSPRASPRTSPRSSRRSSPRMSRRTSPRTSPWMSRRASPKTSPRSSRRTSPRSSPRTSSRTSPRPSRQYPQSNIQPDPPVEKFPELNKMKQKKMSAGRFLTMHKRRKKKLLTRSLYTEKALLDDLSLGQVQCILNQSVQWKFNAFILENVSGGRCLPVLCVHLFQMYGLLSYFKLDAAKAWKLFSLIEEGYHSSNPYHNSVHAADVTQAMHCFLQQERIRDHLTPLEILASLLAAIAHDMDHPGVNQPFLIATSNHLATLYRNTSVLENHHWRSAMSCLIESGILDCLHASPGLRTKLENQISSLILATDITRQQEYLNHFKNHLDMNTLDMTKSEHRHLVLQIALKCADISNPCRPWEISRKWSLKVCEEFFRQGDYERKLNLPVTALCDRHTTSIPKIQTGFFKFVVTPLISEWHRFLQNDLSSQMLRNLQFNQNKWETLVLQEQAEETRTEISDADVVDEDSHSDTNISDSSELLLPPRRRRSLNPARQGALREQFRRFSVPLNVFQDSRFKNRDKNRASSLAESRSRGNGSPSTSEQSIHSQLSVRGHCEPAQEPAEKVLSSEKLLPDSSIASITTPGEASRLNNVIKEGGSWKLVRQQTFPPLESTSRENALAARPLHTSNEDSVWLSRFRPDLLKLDPGAGCSKDDKYSELVVRDLKKTESEVSSSSSAANGELPSTSRSLEKENSEPKQSRRHSSAVGSQLRDNLTSMPLPLDSNAQLQRRRKSVPTESSALSPKDVKVRESPTLLPQLLRRTFSNKESWTRRRGSAPSPVAPSELRGLASLGSLRHSVNGSRRKPSPIATCQQWLAKATYGVHERTLQQFPRRSSLPVEVMTGISSH